MTPEILSSVFQYTLPAICVLIGVIVTSRQVKKVKQETAVIRDHVANTHSTNLRDDLDGVGAKVDRVIDALDMERTERRADTRGTRQELRFIREDIVELRESDTSIWGALKSKVRGESE